jgi:hypothetical protein
MSEQVDTQEITAEQYVGQVHQELDRLITQEKKTTFSVPNGLGKDDNQDGVRFQEYIKGGSQELVIGNHSYTKATRSLGKLFEADYLAVGLNGDKPQTIRVTTHRTDEFEKKEMINRILHTDGTIIVSTERDNKLEPQVMVRPGSTEYEEALVKFKEDAERIKVETLEKEAKLRQDAISNARR